MKRQFAIVLLAALLALPASAARSRAAKPVIDDALSIVFVDAPAADSSFTAAGGDAWLDVRDVAAGHAGSHQRGPRVQRRFGLRLVRTAGTASGMATVTAHLESTDGRTSMRLDGKLLSEAPVIIDTHAPIGAVVFHTLEIEISDAVAPGPIAAAITWEVTAQ
jgi:hypothetical protein